MTNNQSDSDAWDLRFGQVEPGVTVPGPLYPLVQDVSFDFANGSFSASCVSSQTNTTTTPCIDGSFNLYGSLSFATTDLQTNTTSRMRSVDPFIITNDDAPNYLLRDVEVDDSLGGIALQTAVTEPGNCATLKVCLAREPGGDVLAAVGLTLKQLSAFAIYCTTPNSS
jgi:hypothetical protein